MGRSVNIQSADVESAYGHDYHTSTNGIPVCDQPNCEMNLLADFLFQCPLLCTGPVVTKLKIYALEILVPRGLLLCIYGINLCRPRTCMHFRHRVCGCQLASRTLVAEHAADG